MSRELSKKFLSPSKDNGSGINFKLDSNFYLNKLQIVNWASRFNVTVNGRKSESKQQDPRGSSRIGLCLLKQIKKNHLWLSKNIHPDIPFPPGRGRMEGLGLGLGLGLGRGGLGRGGCGRGTVRHKKKRWKNKKLVNFFKNIFFWRILKTFDIVERLDIFTSIVYFWVPLSLRNSCKLHFETHICL